MRRAASKYGLAAARSWPRTSSAKRTPRAAEAMPVRHRRRLGSFPGVGGCFLGLSTLTNDLRGHSRDRGWVSPDAQQALSIRDLLSARIGERGRVFKEDPKDSGRSDRSVQTTADEPKERLRQSSYSLCCRFRFSLARFERKRCGDDPALGMSLCELLRTLIGDLRRMDVQKFQGRQRIERCQ